MVEVCNKHLGEIGKKSTEKNSVQCIWGDAFESIKSVNEDTYDQIFIDLNDDQFCIDLAAKNMDSLVRILKPKGVITAQVGSQDKNPNRLKIGLMFLTIILVTQIYPEFIFQVSIVLGIFHLQ